MRKEPNIIIVAIAKFFVYTVLAMMLAVYGVTQQSDNCEAIAESCVPSAVERIIPVAMYAVSVVLVVSGLAGIVKAAIKHKKG